MDCSPPGSSVHGTSQPRILEWVAISFSRESSQHRNWTHISWIAHGWFSGRILACHKGGPGSFLGPCSHGVPFPGFPVAQRVKNLLAMWETWVWSLGWDDPLEKRKATHSSILAGKSHGWRRLVGYSPWGHKESDTTEWLHFISPTPVFWAGEFHGLYSPWGRKESDTQESVHFTPALQADSSQLSHLGIPK